MAYNRKNKLLQIIAVQQVYQQYKQEGISTAWVYRKYIYPQFHISLPTLYIYLGTPAQKQLKEIATKAAQPLSLAQQQQVLFAAE
jgi:hypothetical protein